MTNKTKIANRDNGYVDVSQEAVLSGKSSNDVKGICTKYPETCTSLTVKEDLCSPKCCVEPTVRVGG